MAENPTYSLAQIIALAKGTTNWYEYAKSGAQHGKNNQDDISTLQSAAFSGATPGWQAAIDLRWYVADTSSSTTTYTGVTKPSATGSDSLFTGYFIIFKPATNNTGASTLNVASSDGAVDIKKISFGAKAALAAGDLDSDNYAELIFDGTDWVLLNPPASAGGRRNIIINGQYDVWQRGTTITSTASANMYYADRWRHEGSAFSGSVTQQTLTNGQTDVPDNPTYFARLIITTNSLGSQAFVQRIENNPVNRFSGKTITVSFWIKSASGTLADGTVKAYGKSALVGSGTDNIGAITTSWQKIEYTGTLGTLTGTYFTVGLEIDQGTLLTSGVDIANFQVEVGGTATPFEYKTYAQELYACERYYQTYGMGFRATGISSAIIDSMFPFRQIMRASPSVALLDTTPTFQEINVASRVGVSSSITTSAQGPDGTGMVRVDGFSSVGVTSICMGNQSTPIFGFDAEL